MTRCTYNTILNRIYISELLENPSEGLTALAWQQGDPNTLLVGSAFGNVFSVDIRAKAASKQAQVHKRGVYRLLSVQPRYLLQTPCTVPRVVKHLHREHGPCCRCNTLKPKPVSCSGCLLKQFP